MTSKEHLIKEKQKYFNANKAKYINSMTEETDYIINGCVVRKEAGNLLKVKDIIGGKQNDN